MEEEIQSLRKQLKSMEDLANIVISQRNVAYTEVAKLQLQVQQLLQGESNESSSD